MKTILISGGTGDLGHIVVPRLLREYRCLVPWRSEESWLALQSGISENRNRLAGLSRDESDDGPLHGVVHLIGGFTAGGMPVDFTNMIEANLLLAVRTITQALPRITDDGRIVAVSSIAALRKPEGLAAYAVSKAALNTYVEVLAKELATRRITVNAIAPDTMDTPKNQGTGEKLVARSDVAETMAFLLSERAASISGQIVALRA